MNDVKNYSEYQEVERIREETQDDGWTLTGFIYDKNTENEQEILNAREFLQRSGADEADPSALLQYYHEEDLYHNMDYDSPIHCTNLGRLSVDPNYLQKQLQASLEKVMDNASFALVTTQEARYKWHGHRCLCGTGIIHTCMGNIPVKWEMQTDA